ncbi:hypothetical protein GUITHDRAFT_139760 [Guillardia theta CCMP2712]|uniref:IPT/TIG domain-containing protein n=1 Tax=Guillardia theta (strain CCMP2712) TaxID=905079 RepID=L1J7L2_GUITC|nr:hypothetical protein GUITHDRAFT_139760 [Guillardia theta CCMP2712]EKX44533.1 hypothetical protein GUITHDRAFT_139760 [Guillardia theta CCMP2712]|eukprot:XP_005831513.1 hypothetical protein GUITHDRAFT_139760 [Guillardia theta CCMP2712]
MQDACRYLYKEPELILRVQPSVCPEHGGLLVTVIGEHFTASEDAVCRFGSSGEDGVSVSARLLICRCPANRAGEVYLDVSSNGVDYSLNKIPFMYTSQVIILSIYPSVAVSSVKTVVQVRTTPVLSSALLCHFGNQSAVAVLESSSILSCTTPAHLPGDVVLRIEEAEHQFSTGVTFAFLEAPRIMSLNPSTCSSGISMIRIVGSGFDKSGAICMLGQEVKVDAEVRSTSVALCKSSAPRDRKNVEVKLVFNALQYTTNGLMLYHYESPMIMKIIPSVVSNQDARVLTVYGDSFVSGGSKVFLHIGSSNMLETSLVSSTKLLCSIPMFQNMGNFSVFLSFERGGTSVSLKGFWFDAGIGSCFFGNVSVKLSVTSSSSAVCVTPPSKTGLVSFKMIFNEVIVLNEKFYYQDRMEIMYVDTYPLFRSGRLKFDRHFQKAASVISSSCIFCFIPTMRAAGIDLEIFNFEMQEDITIRLIGFFHPLKLSFKFLICHPENIMSKSQ